MLASAHLGVRRTIVLDASLALVLLCCSTAPARAAWPPDPAGGLSICTAAVSPANLSLAGDGAGGAYFVWREMRAGNWDVYAQHVRADGILDPRWPGTAAPVCSVTAGVGALDIVGDGLGGAIVLWVDLRDPDGDLYAHHLLPEGIDPAWPVNGLPVCADPAVQQSPVAVADGSGGALIAWLDRRDGNDDVYVHRVLAEGSVDARWPADGRALCTDVAVQQSCAITSDGAGGAIVAWADFRNASNYDLYAARVMENGDRDPFWPANGRLVAGGTGHQYAHTLAADGSGGAVLAWLDTRAGNEDIYAHRVSRSGVLHSAWPTNGRALASRTVSEYDARVTCDASGNAIVVFRAGDTVEGGYDLFAARVLAGGTLDASGSWYSTTYGSGHADVRTTTGQAGSCRVVADGRGNALVAWHDNRGGAYDPYAHRLAADGSFASGWPEDGFSVTTMAGNQYSPRIDSDGTGGLIVGWEDQNAGTAGLYARRVSRFATLAAPEPAIHDVADVASDQGGKVHVLWTPALGDGGGHETIGRYSVWRRTGAEPWNFVAEVPARAAPGYAVMAATSADSTFGNLPWQVFRVLAHDTSEAFVLASQPDSGYSRDDLVPAAPTGFAATYEDGITKLRWSDSREADHAFFRLHRAEGRDPSADAWRTVAEVHGASFDDVTPPPCAYRLTAVDAHGNESGSASLFVGASAANGTGDAWPYHPMRNLPVTMEGEGQYGGSLVSDDAGGAFVCYVHYPSGSGGSQIRAAHLLASGRFDEAWPPEGAPVCVANGLKADPHAVARTSGLVVAWVDFRATYSDIYCQRLTSTGLPSFGWPTDGLAVCTAAESQDSPMIVPSLWDGAIIAWTDHRGSSWDIYAQRVSGSGSNMWAANGVAVATSAGGDELQHLSPDGEGGAYVAWRNSDTGALYVHHLLANGTLDTAWPAGGRLVHANATNAQLVECAGGVIVLSFDGGTALVVRRLTSAGAFDPAWPPGGLPLVAASSVYARGVPDGQNGAMVAWAENAIPANCRVAVQHVTHAGAVATGWPTGGVTLVADVGTADAPFVLLSTYGEPIVAWYLNAWGARPQDVYAQRVVQSGVVDPAWPAGGRAVCLAPGRQAITGLCQDSQGGGLVVWEDERTGTLRLFAQRVELTGALGHPEPLLTSVRDVAGDQGGRVHVEWQASRGEFPPFHGITEYTLWRRLSLEAAASARARGAAVFAAGEAGRPRPGSLRQRADAAGSSWWEYVATVPASGFDSYAFLAPTTADSLPGEVFWNTFFVDAQDTSDAMNLFYPSADDSGYSADNLAPPLTAPAFAYYANGSTSLHWPVSPAPDLAGYRIYRGVTPDFPGEAGLVATVGDTGYVDSPGAPFYYFLNAVDVHGNSSPNALLEPDGILDAPPSAVPLTLGLGPARPNPAPSGVLVPLALPRAAHVRAALLDVAGRRVRVLVDGALPAGEHLLRWDGLDDRGGPCASGLYFVRLETEGRALHARIVRAR